MVPITTDLPKSDNFFPLLCKLGENPGKERDRIVRMKQVLINPWRNASEASTGLETWGLTPAEYRQTLRLLVLELGQDLLDHLSVFQADGNQDGVHWPGIGHVDSGAGVHFGPVEEAIERLLIFFAQSSSKRFQPFTFGFHNMAIRHNCPAHFPSPGVMGQSSGWCR